MDEVVDEAIDHDLLKQLADIGCEGDWSQFLGLLPWFPGFDYRGNQSFFD